MDMTNFGYVVLPFSLRFLFHLIFITLSNHLQLYCLLHFMQTSHHLEGPHQFTTLLGPLLGVEFMVQFLLLNHPQRRKRNSWNFFVKVWKMSKLMMAMDTKQWNQPHNMSWLNLQIALLLSQGLTLLVVVKESWVRIVLPLERNQLSLCSGAFRACPHAEALGREVGRQVLQSK